MNAPSEASDRPEDSILCAAEWLEPAEAQALALRYGLDDLLPAQARAIGRPARALILDPAAGWDWELSSLEFTAGAGWFGVTLYLDRGDRAGLAAAVAWLNEHRSPLKT